MGNVLLLGTVLAAAGPALSLEDCLRLAEAAPSAVAVAARQREIAQARHDQAVAGFLPHLALSAGYTRNSPLPGTDIGSFVSLNGVNQYTALLAATQELDLSGRLRAGWARAAAEREAAELGYRLSRRDLHHAVAATYYRLLLARHLVIVATDILGEAERFAARTELLAKKGEAARADIVRAATEVELLRQARQAAELDATLANQELAAFWTDDVTAPLAVVDLLEQPAPPPEVVTARPRPELALLEAQRRGLLAEARAARAGRYPQASVTAEYGIDANRVDWRDRGYAVVAALTVPLFDWSAAASVARALMVQSEQVTLEAQSSRRAFAREQASAAARVRALYDQIATTVAQVRLSEENLKLSRIRYEGGEGSALEVVTAQTQLAQARGNLYQVRAAHLTARADLAVASGAP
jgi:outer membrane protein